MFDCLLLDEIIIDVIDRNSIDRDAQLTSISDMKFCLIDWLENSAKRQWGGVDRWIELSAVSFHENFDR
jgi:hypothetical protein